MPCSFMVALIISPKISHPRSPFSPGLISNLSTQFVHPAFFLSGSFQSFGNLYNVPRRILIFIPNPFPLMPLGDALSTTKKISGISSSSPQGKIGITSEAHVFSQLWPVHMIRTFKGIIHLMASSPAIFFQEPPTAPGHHVLKGRWGMLGWPCYDPH